MKFWREFDVETTHTFLGCTQMHPPGASMHRAGASVVRTGASMHPSQINIVNRKDRCKHTQSSTCEVRYLFSTVFASHVNAETMGTVWNLTYLRCTDAPTGASRCIWVHPRNVWDNQSCKINRDQKRRTIFMSIYWYYGASVRNSGWSRYIPVFLLMTYRRRRKSCFCFRVLCYSFPVFHYNIVYGFPTFFKICWAEIRICCLFVINQLRNL